MFDEQDSAWDPRDASPHMAVSDAGALAYAECARQHARTLIERHYALLIDVARAKRRRARLGDTMSTIDLLHEAYARLGVRDGFVDDAHFVRAVNLAMRHVIIDHARAKLTGKRGGGQRAVTLDDRSPVLPEFSETPEQIVGIASLLEGLEAMNPRWLLVVDARYFGGMTETETAQVLGVSERTIRRDWTEARAWLAEQMGIAA